MEIGFVGPALNIKLDQEDKTISLENGFYLSNNKEIIKEFFDTPSVVEAIGTLDFNSFLNSTYVFSIGEEEFYLQSYNTPNISSVLGMLWGPLQLFQLSLWMIKDNALNFDFLCSYKPENKFVLQSRRNVWDSNSRGNYGESAISNQELVDAIKWQESLIPYMVISGNGDGEEIPLTNEEEAVFKFKTNTFRTENVNRFSRALNFIQAARNQSMLPVKIASYIGALESLFDVDSELSHQVSERAAKLVGGDLDTRVLNYNLVKEAYGIRSKYVHGSILSNKHRSEDKLAEVAVSLDVIVRKIMQTLILKHSELAAMKNNDLTDWYKRIILQG